MASRRMPRLMAWVARVWRSRWGVHVVDAGDGADAGDDAVDGSSVDACVVVGEQAAAVADVFAVGGGPFGEQFDDVGVHGDHAVVAEFADGDA